MKLIVDGQKIYPYDSPPVMLVEGSVNFVDLEFDFSGDWDGLSKTVQFIQKGNTLNVFLGEESNVCKVPAEIKEGWLMISVFGVEAGQTVKATVQGYEVEVAQAGFSSSEQTPIPPTPDLYSQLVQQVKQYSDEAQESADKVKEAQETAQEAKIIADQIQQNAEDGLYNGKDGEMGPEGPQGPQGIQGEQGPRGEQGPKGDSGNNGVTFTPSVSEDGVISWTNNGEEENPQPVNIKGPQGIQGPKGDIGAQGPQGEKGDVGPQGDKGDPGETGAPGKDGTAATVTVGTVITGEPDIPASVTNGGTENAAVFDFVIPRGEKGDSAFTSIKPGTKNEPYIIQKYGYYCTTGVGWVQVGTQGQDISTISELEFYKPFYCGTNTLIIFGMSNEYVNAESAFIYIITVGDDIKASVYPATSGSTKEPFNYSLEEIILSLMAYVNIFQPVFDEGANAVDKVIKVGSYDNSHGIFQLAPTDEYRKKSAIIAQTNSNITLNDNAEYRMQVTATINLTLPTSINDDYECSLIFESGDTATALSYAADSIKFVGDDCDAEGDFIPQANTAYEVNIKNLGYNRIIARVGAF